MWLNVSFSRGLYNAVMYRLFVDAVVTYPLLFSRFFLFSLFIAVLLHMLFLIFYSNAQRKKKDISLLISQDKCLERSSRWYYFWQSSLLLIMIFVVYHSWPYCRISCCNNRHFFGSMVCTGSLQIFRKVKSSERRFNCWNELFLNPKVSKHFEAIAFDMLNFRTACLIIQR